MKIIKKASKLKLSCTVFAEDRTAMKMARASWRAAWTSNITCVVGGVVGGDADVVAVDAVVE